MYDDICYYESKYYSEEELEAMTQYYVAQGLLEEDAYRQACKDLYVDREGY